MKTQAQSVVRKVVSNEIGSYKVSYTNRGTWRVMGTGMLAPRFCNSFEEAEEYAMDQLLILTLENDLAVESN